MPNLTPKRNTPRQKFTRNEKTPDAAKRREYFSRKQGTNIDVMTVRDAILPLALVPRYLVAATVDEIAATLADEPRDDDRSDDD